MRYPLKSHERLALLEAWSGACAWCTRPILYDEMQVDHLLPCDVLNAYDEDERQETFRRHLPDFAKTTDPIAFDLHSLPNLAPACGRDNRIKSSKIPPIASVLLLEAHGKVEQVQSLADRYLKDKSVQSALSILTSAEEGIRTDAVSRLIGTGIDTSTLRRLVRLNVAFSTVEYPMRFGGTATRRIWLVVPPAKLPVAVILEDASDEGTAIQNAAEEIALQIKQHYPTFVTVLHYDKEYAEKGKQRWSTLFIPVPIDSAGNALFAESTPELDVQIRDSLGSVGLIPRDEDTPD